MYVSVTDLALMLLPFLLIMFSYLAHTLFIIIIHFMTKEKEIPLQIRTLHSSF